MRTLRGLAALAAVLALGGCDGPQSVLDTHGPAADQLKSLIIWIVAVCSVVWMLVMVVLIAALSRSQRSAASPRQTSPRRMGAVITAAVGATAVIIIGFTVASFYATRAVTSSATASLAIKVRGQQWWWALQYLDPDLARMFTTANEIRIPVGRTVNLELEAVDVIHSFWVPSLAGKLDLIPGRTNTLTIRAERAGVYRGQCAEFCGLQHSHMALFVIAEPEADFERWRDLQRQNAAPPASPEIKAGEAVFLSKPCAACHTIRGTPAAGTTGPDLTHFANRRTLAAGVFENTRGSVAAWIADPQTIKPGNNMPLVPLSAEELQQLSAYMTSLK